MPEVLDHQRPYTRTLPWSRTPDSNRDESFTRALCTPCVRHIHPYLAAEPGFHRTALGRMWALELFLGIEPSLPRYEGGARAIREERVVSARRITH